MVNNPFIVKVLFIYFFFSLVVLFTIIVIGIAFFLRRRKKQKPKLTNRSTSHSHRAAIAHTRGITGVRPTEYLHRFSTMTDTARYQ